jgi:hypothetical protein
VAVPSMVRLFTAKAMSDQRLMGSGYARCHDGVISAVRCRRAAKTILGGNW